LRRFKLFGFSIFQPVLGSTPLIILFAVSGAFYGILLMPFIG
jgi:hypothetical protein